MKTPTIAKHLPRRTRLRAGANKSVVAIPYKPSRGVGQFATCVARATPLELIALEREGVQGRFVKDLSVRLGIPLPRLLRILDLPKASGAKRIAAGKAITGAGGYAAITLAKLIAKASALVESSTAPGAKGFDATKWLGRWLETPQPALGGRRPSDISGTPTGAELVSRLLGAIGSGAYQ